MSSEDHEQPSNQDQSPRVLKPSELRKLWHGDETEVAVPPLAITPPEPALDDEQVAFLLNRIPETNRHYEFERFALCLCEAELCRNIQPSTGPTAGGGDAGADATTYAVAPGAQRPTFWVGRVTSEVADEDWVFAFSTEVTWTAKVRRDAKKAAARDPRPGVFIFVTSQAAQASTRQRLEREISREHGFKAQIHDREWIIHQVVQKGHQVPALKYLGGSELATGVGGADHPFDPQQPDDECSRRITDLRGRIPYRQFYGNYVAHRVEDLLELAELLRPDPVTREEVTKLCDEAISEARHVHAPRLLVRAIYTLFWTSLWYWDDPAPALPYLEDMFTTAADANDPEAFELCFNVLLCLMGAQRQGLLSADQHLVDSLRPIVLPPVLQLIRRERSSSASLRLRGAAASERAARHLYDIRSANKLITALTSIARQSDRYPLYPLQRLSRIVVMLHPQLSEFPGFSALVALIEEKLALRSGDSARALFINNLGWEAFNKGSYTEAFQHFGRAKLAWFTEETIGQSVTSALLTGGCYYILGLNLAAKLEMLSTLHYGTFFEDRLCKDEVLHALRILYAIEKKRGKHVAALRWALRHEQLRAAWRMPECKGPGTKLDFTVLVDMEAALLVGYAQRFRPSVVERLKPLLSKLGLPTAGLLLTAADQGVETAVAAHGLDKKAAAGLQASLDTVSQMEEPPRGFEDIQDETTGPSVDIFEVAGITFTLKSDTTLRARLVAESLGAVLQVALSALRLENWAFIEDEVVLAVSANDSTSATVIRTDTSNWQRVRVNYSVSQPAWDALVAEGGKRAADWLYEELLHVLTEMCMDPLDDVLAELKWLSQTGVFSRAISCGSIMIYGHTWEKD